jgi:repressor LexA
LDDRAIQILVEIEDYWSANGWFPSIREIAQAVGFSSPSSVHRHLVTLEHEGFIERYGPQNRYRLTEKELPRA